MGIERIHERHGMCKSPAYYCWAMMKNRCYNESSNRYYLYGGRGITVCPQWLHSFSTFIKDIGERPSPRHTIEREDSNGNYCPENCRWATYAEQNRNVSRNVLFEFDGRTMCARDWDIAYGHRPDTVARRVKRGWSIEKAITTSDERPQFLIDMENRRFGRVVAESFAGKIKGRNWWNCRCDCGEMHLMRVDVLLRGTQPNCKCQR